MAQRVSFNLFSKHGRASFFRGGRLFGDKWSRQYVLRDTFGRHICSLLGHSDKTFQSQEAVNVASNTICLRCFSKLGEKETWTETHYGNRVTSFHGKPTSTPQTPQPKPIKPQEVAK